MHLYDRGFYIILILGILMTGCSIAAGTYKIAVDERSLGEQYDDEAITMRIRKKIMKDDEIKYFDISTYVYHGQVYLVGEYDTVDRKNRVVKLAGQVEGARSVTSFFLPKQEDDTCETTTNLELLANVKTALIGDRDISAIQVEVKALQCNIILLGVVGSEDEIKKAVSHAKNVEGVRSIISFLKIQN